MLQNVVGDPAGERALNGHMDPTMALAKQRQQRQEKQAGVLIGRQAQAAEVQGAQLRERCPGLCPQVQNLAGVLLQHLTGIGKGAVSRGALKECLPEIGLQLGNNLADGRLRPVQPGRGTREAALLGYGKEYLKLV